MTTAKKITRWLKMSQQDVLDNFHKAYENSGSILCEETQGAGFVYVPGKRKDAALLIAHADTVWGDNRNIDVCQVENVLMSNNRRVVVGTNKKLQHTMERSRVYGIGIGADDRAGCAMVWELADLGHSILITTGEEYGCIASSVLASTSLINEIQKHSFAIEFDRKGRNDLVFYNVSTDDFEDYCIENTGYQIQAGSSSDIAVLCQNICGVNISVGYRNEHTPNELLIIPWWNNTFKIVKKWLTKPLPTFDLI